MLLVALLGEKTNRILFASLLAIAMLCFLGAHHVWTSTRSTLWFSGDASRGTRALLRAGTGIACGAALAGTIFGPSVPNPDAAAWDWDSIGDDSQSTQYTASPLVTMHQRLVNQGTDELFTVAASGPAYWRAMSLDSFSGDTFSAKVSFDGVSGEIPSRTTRATATETIVNQRFDITDLGQLWMPAAFEPTKVEILSGGDTEARYDRASATLTPGGGADVSDGFNYSVQSAVPVHVAERLRETSGDVPNEIADTYLQLPQGFSQQVAETAAQVTQGATHPFDSAIALELFFRTNFEYDLDLGFDTNQRHSETVMERFLTERRGYCEQFSTTFAAMARTIGIPSRVAVGFTWGEATSVDETSGVTTYSVQGRHSHAWPELYFADVGWVPFEPTPGRGLPQNQGDHSTATPAQDPDLTPLESDGVTTTTSPDSSSSTTEVSEPADIAPVTVAVAPTDSESNESQLSRWMVPILVLAGLAALWALSMALLRKWLHHRRHSHSNSASDRTSAAWADALDDLALLGLVPEDSETIFDFVQRVSVVAPDHGEPARQLALEESMVLYSARGASAEGADRAEQAAAKIAELSKEGVSLTRRTAVALRPPRSGLRRD